MTYYLVTGETDRMSSDYHLSSKVNQYMFRYEQALWAAGASGAQISKQSVHEDGKNLIRTHQLLLPLRKYSWYSLLSEAESTPGP
jgi:hypothetical protein